MLTSEVGGEREGRESRKAGWKGSGLLEVVAGGEGEGRGTDEDNESEEGDDGE